MLRIISSSVITSCCRRHHHHHHRHDARHHLLLLPLLHQALRRQQQQERVLTTTAAAATIKQNPFVSSQSEHISRLILKITDNDVLIRALHEASLSIHWSPPLVDSILKRLWNHGPKALFFFHFLLRRGYSHGPSSFNHAIDIAARLRRYPIVFSLLSHMRQRGIQPSPLTFSIILERFVSAGKPEKAVRLFLSMHRRGCPHSLSSFNSFLDILCKSRRVEFAYSFFRTLAPSFGPDVVSYNIIANGWCAIKRTPRALQILKEMVERGLNPNNATYNILLNGFFRAGQLKEAWEFFLQMKKRGCEPDVVTYTTVVHGFGIAGEIEKARKVFDEMIGCGCLPSVATYTALIQVLCKKDSVENALEVFDEMLKKGYMPNTTTYNVLIRGLCHAGDFDRARDLMEKMKADDCEPNVQTFNVLIRYLCGTGEIEKGLAVFAEMANGDRCLPNLDTYNLLITKLFATNKADDMLMAGKLLMEMTERGFVPRKFVYNRVLNGLLLTGNQGFAKEILRVQSSGGRVPREIRL